MTKPGFCQYVEAIFIIYLTLLLGFLASSILKLSNFKTRMIFTVGCMYIDCTLLSLVSKFWYFVCARLSHMFVYLLDDAGSHHSDMEEGQQYDTQSDISEGQMSDDDDDAFSNSDMTTSRPNSKIARTPPRARILQCT